MHVNSVTGSVVSRTNVVVTPVFALPRRECLVKINAFLARKN